ncbi:GNAT family N-acetyltransferase [Desulfobacterales bacterium HSG16]|nr:GNAT family N-acetyltransferase [Desulfobacterales bacterium HSG16]
MSQIKETKISMKKWKDLRETVCPGHEFMAHQWFNAWEKSFLPSDGWRAPLYNLKAFDRYGKLSGVLPLAVQVKFGFKLLALGGYYFPFRSIPIAEDEYESACLMFADMLDRFPKSSGLRLGPVQANDKGVLCLVRMLAEKGWHLFPIKIPYMEFILHLPDSYDTYKKEILGKKYLKRLRYYTNKMKKHGTFAIKAFTSRDSENFDEILAILQKIESESWLAAQGGVMKFMGRRNFDFWHRVFNDKNAPQSAKVWILYFNQQPVSFLFTIDSGACRYALAQSYSLSVSAFSTGPILYSQAMEDSIADKISIINLGIGDEHFKRQWGGIPESSQVDWLAFRPDFGGRLLYSLILAKTKIDKFRQYIKKIKAAKKGGRK